MDASLVIMRRPSDADGTIEVRALRILLAEDDPELRRLLAARLRKEGFDVREAADGRQLGDLLRAATQRQTGAEPSIDLVLSDVRMPGRSGLDVLAELSEARKHVPFVLLTAFGDDSTCAEARRLGAAALIDKPVDLDDLCGTLFCLMAAPPPMRNRRRPPATGARRLGRVAAIDQDGSRRPRRARTGHGG
jgi:CheY-like chemotaxis protein